MILANKCVFRALVKNSKIEIISEFYVKKVTF